MDLKLENLDLGVNVHIFSRNYQIDPELRDMNWEGRLTYGQSWCRGSHIGFTPLAGGFYNKDWDGQNPNTFLQNNPHYQILRGVTIGHCIAPIEKSENDWLRFDQISTLESHLRGLYPDLEDYYFNYHFTEFLHHLQTLKTQYPNQIVLIRTDGDWDIAILYDPDRILTELYWIEEVIDQHQVTQEWI